MGEKGLGTDPGVVGTGAPDPGRIGGAVPGGAIISAARPVGLPGSGSVEGLEHEQETARGISSPTGSSADRGAGAPDAGAGVGDGSSGARATGTVVIKNIPGGGTLDRQPGDSDLATPDRGVSWRRSGTLDRLPGDSDPLGGPGIVGTGAPDPGVGAADVKPRAATKEPGMLETPDI